VFFSKSLIKSQTSTVNIFGPKAGYVTSPQGFELDYAMRPPSFDENATFLDCWLAPGGDVFFHSPEVQKHVWEGLIEIHSVGCCSDSTQRSGL
jgi:hypothetical protein